MHPSDAEGTSWSTHAVRALCLAVTLLRSCWYMLVMHVGTTVLLSVACYCFVSLPSVPARYFTSARVAHAVQLLPELK